MYESIAYHIANIILSMDVCPDMHLLLVCVHVSHDEVHVVRLLNFTTQNYLSYKYTNTEPFLPCLVYFKAKRKMQSQYLGTFTVNALVLSHRWPKLKLLILLNV